MCINYKQDLYFSELLQLLKFVSLFICIVENFSKCGPIPLFSDTFNTKYRAKNFTDTDSDTDSDTDTNAYKHMVAIISHLLLYKYIDKAFK